MINININLFMTFDEFLYFANPYLLKLQNIIYYICTVNLIIAKLIAMVAQ